MKSIKNLSVCFLNKDVLNISRNIFLLLGLKKTKIYEDDTHFGTKFFAVAGFARKKQLLFNGKDLKGWTIYVSDSKYTNTEFGNLEQDQLYDLSTDKGEKINSQFFTT